MKYCIRFVASMSDNGFVRHTSLIPRIVLVVCIPIICEDALAGQPITPQDVEEREAARQREQERQRLQEMQDAQPDVRLQPEEAPSDALEYPPDESPSFLIREIRLEGDMSEKFQWALKTVSDALGRSLGGKGVNVVMTRIQNAIVDKGFVTTRVVAEPQDLKPGILVLKLIPGIVSDVVLAEGSGKHISLYPMIPLRKTRILNIRAIEQGLENIRRIPTVESDFKLIPGEKMGESKVEVSRTQRFPVRVMLSADDSGSRYTGKNQGTATLFLDNMLGLSDMFSASIGRNIEHRHKSFGTDNYSIYYSVPWTYWQLTFSHSNQDYHQTVVGYASNYVYSGESQNTILELSRVIHRSAKSKTSLSLGGWFATSRNYVDDTELEIQRRRMAGWEAGVNHRHFIGQAVFDADFRYKHGTGAFDALHAPEEELDEGTARPHLATLSLRLNIPFKIKSQNFRFSTSWRQQWALNKVLQRDRMSIGSRYSVRGYDGEFTLSGDNGFTSRSELSYSIPKINQELYGAFDAGRVWGSGDEWLLGQSLSGVALGLRGSIKKFSYDAWISRPVNKPANYPGERWVYGFNANLTF